MSDTSANNSAPSKRDRNIAILHILISALGFALMSLFVRLSGDLPTMQKAFFRNFFAIFVAIFLLVRGKTSLRVLTGCRFPMVMRCVLGTTGLMANFYAIDHMGIADSNMLNKLSPFFAIIMSYFIMKELANKVDWACVVVAFCGAIFIIRPSLGMAILPAMIAVYGAFAAGTSYAFVHKMGSLGQPGSTIVFYFSVFSCLATLPFMLISWVPPTWQQLLFLVCAGICGCLAQFNITAAYEKAPPRDISVFDYTQVLFAAMLAFFILGEVPDILSIVGYVIIIGAAVFKWQYARTK